MIRTTHHLWEYTWTHDDFLERHENPDYSPIHYPNFSDKKWKSIYHIHRKALRLLEKEKAENEKEELQKIQMQFIETIRSLIIKKEELKRKHTEEKGRLWTLWKIQSGNKRTIMQTLLETDYTELDDNFILWLWNISLFYEKKGPDKTTRNNASTILVRLRPIMIERTLPLWWQQLINRLAQIPSDEIKKYAKNASGFK